MRGRARERWWLGPAVAGLTLLIVAAGLCCLGQESTSHHGLPVDLCAMAIMMLVVGAFVATLVLVGLTPAFGHPLFATIALSVPKPPPRRIRFS